MGELMDGGKILEGKKNIWIGAEMNGLVGRWMDVWVMDR